MDKVRYGIIGIGNMGSAHAAMLYRGDIPGAELAAVCDIDPARLRWAEASCANAERFSDYRELLKSKKVDAVIIATPHYLHPVIATEAFDAGLAVLSEKPIGVYTKAIYELNAKALECKLPFCIMYNQRTNPVYQKMREIVRSGEIGQIKRVVWLITNWYRSQAYYNSGSWRATWAGEGGGVLLNQCPHNLDLWQWICGMPVSVRAFMSFGKHHSIEVEDDVTIYAEYENGATGLFVTSTGEAPGTNRFEISGTGGSLVYDGKLRFRKNLTDERDFNRDNTSPFGAPKCQEEVFELPPSPEHKGILCNFTNHLLYGEELLSPGIEGINGLSISNAAHLSQWQGNRAVSLPNDGEEFYAILKEKIAQSNVKDKTESVIADVEGTFNS